MTRLQELEQAVVEFYNNKNPNREVWADWLIDNHVRVVADYSTELARRFSANEELSRVAALLHDIADVKMKRSDPDHENESLKIGRELMTNAGFTEDEISLVIDDAVRYHSCHGDERPKSLEGKILATADALGHFKRDFYVFATWALGREKTLEELKEWVLKKIDRDINNKIHFEEIRAEVMPEYDLIKSLYSR